MSATTPALPPPSLNQPYMHVSALEAGLLEIPMDLAIQGEPRTSPKCPSLSFYLKHSASERNFIFDLGLRRDLHSYPPKVYEHYIASGMTPSEVPQTVAESCEKGGVDPAEVQMVVISHLHW